MATPAQSVPEIEIPWESPQAEPPPDKPSRPHKRLTKKTLAKRQEQVFLDHADEMLDLMVKGIKMRLKEGNVEILKKTMEMVNWVQAPRGISIVNQLAQQNNIKADNAQADGIVYFESLVRRLADRKDQPAQLTAAGADVIDAEVISQQDDVADDD